MPAFIDIIAPALIGLVAGGAVGALIVWQLGRRRAAQNKSAEPTDHLSAMTSGLAHEIKNPLSTIGLNAQLLGEAIGELDAPEDDIAPIRRRLDALSRETDRLAGILQDFLEFAGEVRLVLRETDVAELAEELGDFFSAQAARAGVRLRVERPPGELRATIDADHVKQAAMNLLLNAMQAMERAGSPQKELIVRAAEARLGSRDAVALHVIDTGPGIDAEGLAKIFDPYFTTRPGGTGLGLPTTKRLIEAHGGRIDVFSEPGTGTDFAILLPVKPTLADSASG
ncbi:MAG: ATP-binding protein [Planctomycetota bacterium]